MKRVIVCDSGLGGLNIASRLFAPGAACGEKCEVIYFNAYPSQTCGFNKLPTLRDQEEVFRDVLESMKKFSPDLCLIACNTLSIVYERLAQWYTPSFPVAGIVDAAVEGMFRALEREPGSALLILGTKSTVESKVYEQRLLSRGIAPERIQSLAAPGLATLIESDPADTAVSDTISGLAHQSAALFPAKPSQLFLGLCCTHFGFASEIWLEQFKKFVTANTALVNPNELLGNDLCGTNFCYHAKIGFFPGARENMSAYFEPHAPQIAAALQKPLIDKELFHFQEGKYQL